MPIRTTARLSALLLDPRVLLFTVAALAGCALYASTQWGSFDEFLAAIDHTPRVFVDFLEFWIPAGDSVLSGEPIPEGYYYSPTFALLMKPFAWMERDTAVAVWGALQVAATLLLLIVPGLAFFRRSKLLFCLYVLIFLCSVPLLQNFKWGQVSVLMTLLVWACLLVYRSGRVLLAAGLLALSVSIKFYTAAFLVWFVFRKDLRFVLGSVLCIGALMLVVPFAVLGTEATLDYYDALFAQIAAARTKLVGDHNSQFLAHVVARGASSVERLVVNAEPRAPSALLIDVCRWAGWGVCLLNLVLVWRLSRRGSLFDMLEAFGVLFLSTPFVVETSWPHYFVYLPVIQAVALWRLLAMRGQGAVRTVLLWAMLLGSLALSSTLLHQEIGAFRHGQIGMLFFANLLLLATMHLVPRKEV